VIFESGVSSSRDGDVFHYGWVQTPESFNAKVAQGFYFDGNLSDAFSRNALQLRPQSLGGNVTSVVVETLAVCSECANITSFLKGPQRCDPNKEQADPCASTNERRWDLPNSATTLWTDFADRSTLVISASSGEDPLILDTSDRLTILNLTAIVGIFPR